MAGVDPRGSFSGDVFRTAIRAAMSMGSPTVVEDRATFHFADGRTFTVADDTGNPYDWTLAPDGGLAARASVQVLCAIDTKSAVGARGQPRTPVGEFDEDTATLFLFEDEWALVSDFTSVDLGGSTYVRIKRLIPLGLFDVQVEQVHVRAVDES